MASDAVIFISSDDSSSVGSSSGSSLEPTLPQAVDDNAMDVQESSLQLNVAPTQPDEPLEPAEPAEPAAESDEDADEPSALQLARQYGLAVDHRWESPWIDLASLPWVDNDDELRSETADSEDTVRAVCRELEQEKLDVKADVVQIVYEATSGPLPADKLEAALAMVELSQVKSCAHKLETPLLPPMLDLELLRLQGLSRPDLSAMLPPSAPVDAEMDEDSDWPAQLLLLPDLMDDEIAKEKLDVGADVAVLLYETHGEKLSEEAVEAVHEEVLEELQQQRDARMTNVSPPLLPAQSQYFSEALSSPKLELEPWSEGPDPDRSQLEKIEEDLFQDDGSDSMDLSGSSHIMHQPSGNGEENPRVYSPFRSTIESSTPDASIRKMRDHHVEVPLEYVSNPAASALTRIESTTTDLEQQAQDVPRWDGCSSDSLSDPLKFMKSLADKANQAIDQEELTEVDSTMRVDVPGIEPVKRTPPWATWSRLSAPDVPFPDELTAQRRMLREECDEHSRRYPLWTDGSVKERDLRWRPFPERLGNYVLNEEMEKSDYLEELLRSVEHDVVCTSDELAYKPEGLRILDCSDEEESEIEAGALGAAEPCLEMLIRKRKLEMSELESRDEPATNGATGSSTRKQADIQSPIDIPASLPEGDAETVAQIHPHQDPANSSHISKAKRSKSFDVDSAGFSIHKFLALQGVMTPKLALTAHLQGSSTIATDPRLSKTFQPVVHPESPSLPSPFELAASIEPLKLPGVPADAPERTFIYSLELLQTRRSLFRDIESRYLSANLVEREYLALCRRETTARLPVHNYPHVHSNPCAEADIIISPSTGLVLTTIQKIAQLSLPGEQPQIYSFHDRLQQMAVRYERLIVLVSQGIETVANSKLGRVSQPAIAAAYRGIYPIPPLTTSQLTAIAALQALASTLATEVIVRFIPGSERELSAWAVHHMHTFSGPIKHKVPIEESLWEQTLRRAGLNCYAAAVILEKLQREQEDDDDDEENEEEQARKVWGLPAFLKMSAEERMEKFAGLLDGTRMLIRLNTCLERGWISESNGFENGN